MWRDEWRRGLACGAGAVLLLGAPLTAQEERPRERREGCECPRLRIEGAPLRAGMSDLRVFFGGGRLGIQVDMEEAEPSRGALIREVLPHSPAEEAGLEEGDEIVALDGTSLLRALPEDEPRTEEDESAAARRLIVLMGRTEPGDTVRLEVLRGGERRDVTVVTRESAFGAPHIRAFEGELPRMFRFEGSPSRVGPGARGFLHFGGPRAILGARVEEMEPALAEYFGVERGLLVLDVADDAPLELRPGDVIVSVGGRDVRDAAHLRDIVASYREDEPVRVEVVRKGARLSLEARPAR